MWYFPRQMKYCNVQLVAEIYTVLQTTKRIVKDAGFLWGKIRSAATNISWLVIKSRGRGGGAARVPRGNVYCACFCQPCKATMHGKWKIRNTRVLAKLLLTRVSVWKFATRSPRVSLDEYHYPVKPLCKIVALCNFNFDLPNCQL